MMLHNTRFRAHIDIKPEGSVTLGFLDATITQGDLHVDLYGVVVRLKQDGTPALSFPTRTYMGRDGNPRYARTVRFDESSYALMLEAVFALPSVHLAVSAAEVERAA